MTLKQYLVTMLAVTIVGWLIWFVIVITVNPATTNWIGFLLFYSALFLAVSGTAALAGFIIRFVIFKKELAFRLVKEAFRQSFLFAALLVSSLILLSQGLFSWLNMLLLVIGLSALEFFLLNLQKQRKP